MLAQHLHSEGVHLLPKLALALNVRLFQSVKALIECLVCPLALCLDISLLKAQSCKCVLQLLNP